MKFNQLFETESPDTHVFLNQVVQALSGSLPRIRAYLAMSSDEVSAKWQAVVNAAAAKDQFVMSDLLDLRDALVDDGHVQPNEIKSVMALAHKVHDVILDKGQID